MIDPGRLYDYLKERGTDFYTGVPDSGLKDLLQYLQERSGAGSHVITANEGLAVALAAGYHFRYGKIPVVYLQNSGLGNIINPLTSLADPEMYAIPMLLLIGWRGRPGTKDEPQHKKMGRITVPLLQTLEIPTYILPADEPAALSLVDEALQKSRQHSSPVALLVPEGIFTPYTGSSPQNTYTLDRETSIAGLIRSCRGDETVICTTGKTGREFYEQNRNAGHKIKKYILSVGAMGHASHIALGTALTEAQQRTLLLDGDGALLMHLGALSTIPGYAKSDFIHIVLNNGSHESVGGQPTAGFSADLCGIAAACGYPSTRCITTEEAWEEWLREMNSLSGLHFVELRIRSSSRNDLGRPPGDPAAWKKAFMNALQNNPD